MARQLVVEIVGDASKFSKATQDATKSAGKFSASAVKGFGLGVGLGVFSLATSAIGSVTEKLVEAKAAYEEDQKSVALLDNALRKNAKGWDGNTDAIEANIKANQAKGVSDSLQREGIVAFINKTGDATQAQLLNNAAIELAAGTGKTYEQAQAAIISGLNGKTAALGKDGVAIDKNASATEVATAILDKYSGSQDKMAETAEGKTAIANEKVGESMERIGEVVSKVAQVALPILADAFEVVVNVLGDVWKEIEPVVSALVRDLQPAFNQIMNILKTVVFPIFKTLIGVYINVMATQVRVLATVFKTAFDIIASVINAVLPTVTTVIGNIKTAFSNLVSFITGIPGRIKSAASGMFSGIWGAFKTALNMVIRAWNSIKFTLPKVEVAGVTFGGFTLGTPNLPYFHSGGIVPGTPGSDVPIMAQAGEEVIARKNVGKQGITINFNGPVFGGERAIDELTRAIAMRLKTVGG